MVTIGDLRDRITLEYNNSVTDRVRGQTENWSTLATVWARVEPLGSQLQTLAAQRGVYATHRATLRYQAVAPLLRVCGDKRLRVKYGGRYYDVAGLTTDKRTYELTLREAP